MTKKIKINFTLNESPKTVEVDGGEALFDLLKALGITSVKKSCGTGSCGICTVLMDGKPIPSCSYLAVRAEGHAITTIEGVREEAERLGSFMNEEGAVQCGFCTPAFLLTVISMKRELENPSEEEIKSYLSGNLCRCSGYEGQLRAVKKYLGVQ